MTPTQSSQNFIQQALESLNQKFDSFIATLPNTYVTIRSHEIQIKAHDERIDNNARRLDALEASNTATGKWSIEQHDNMRKEWTGEVKDANTKLDNLDTNVVIMTEQQKHQTTILTWVLGIFTALTITVIGSFIVALFTHLIHF